MENWQNMICRFQMAVSETEKGEFDLLVSKFQPLRWEGPPARKTNRGVNMWNSQSIHFILMMTKIYVNYGDLHANELLRDAILSTNVSVKAKKSCDHHASGNFISKQMVNSCIWQERQLQKPTYLRWKKTSQNSVLFVFKTAWAHGKHEVQLENLNPFPILKLFAQTRNITAWELINKNGIRKKYYNCF